MFYFMKPSTNKRSKIESPGVLTAGEAHVVWNSLAVANSASRTGGSIRCGRSLLQCIFWEGNLRPEPCTHHHVARNCVVVEMVLQTLDLLQHHGNMHSPARHSLLVLADEDKVPGQSCSSTMSSQLDSFLLEESIPLGFDA